MGDKRSTCLHIDRGVLEAARRAGLNLSRVSENALRDPFFYNLVCMAEV